MVPISMGRSDIVQQNLFTRLPNFCSTNQQQPHYYALTKTVQEVSSINIRFRLTFPVIIYLTRLAQGRFRRKSFSWVDQQFICDWQQTVFSSFIVDYLRLRR